jgi:uncharacterized Zn finger protein (UPF0148 family)
MKHYCPICEKELTDQEYKQRQEEKKKYSN